MLARVARALTVQWAILETCLGRETHMRACAHSHPPFVSVSVTDSDFQPPRSFTAAVTACPLISGPSAHCSTRSVLIALICVTGCDGDTAMLAPSLPLLSLQDGPFEICIRRICDLSTHPCSSCLFVCFFIFIFFSFSFCFSPRLQMLTGLPPFYNQNLHVMYEKVSAPLTIQLALILAHRIASHRMHAHAWLFFFFLFLFSARTLSHPSALRLLMLPVRLSPRPVLPDYPRQAALPRVSERQRPRTAAGAARPKPENKIGIRSDTHAHTHAHASESRRPWTGLSFSAGRLTEVFFYFCLFFPPPPQSMTPRT